jgi:hypothetical protein
MKKVARLSVFSIAAALLIVMSVLVSAAQEGHKKSGVKARPKPTQPVVQQQVLPEIVKSVIPGAQNYYERAVQNPNIGPDYSNPDKYQNPIVRHYEFGDSETLRKAQEWLKNPSIAPDSRNNLPSGSNIRRGPQNEFFTRPALVPATVTDAKNTVNTYGSVPTGMVLEGKASGIGAVDDVQYDAILNALVFNERTVYFSPVAPQSLAVLCRALDKDPRIGVALGAVEITYGKLPHESQVAVDLKLADSFLGNITFAQSHWLPKNYPLAPGYEAQSDPSPEATAVTFTFKDFQFQTAKQIVRASGVRFEVRLLPLSDQPAMDGGALPDYDAIAQGWTSPQFTNNARHVSNNIDYYRRESFVDNAFRYGEAAALLRTLQAENFDLAELANVIEQTTAVGPLEAAPPIADMQQPIKRLFASWKTLDLQQYLAQWSPNAVQIGPTKTASFADIRESRERLFAQLTAAGAANSTILLGYHDGVGLFRNEYTLEYRDQQDQLHHGAACETYKVRNESGRWVIIENQEDKSC